MSSPLAARQLLLAAELIVLYGEDIQLASLNLNTHRKTDKKKQKKQTASGKCSYITRIPLTVFKRVWVK